jgi:hypothetical protein
MCPKAYVQNVGYGLPWQGYRSKLSLFLRHLESRAAQLSGGTDGAKDHLVALIDSDVIYGGCTADDFLSRYRKIVRASGAPVVAGAEFNCYAPPGGKCSNYPAEHRREVLDAFQLSDEKMQSLANESAKPWPCSKKFCNIDGVECRQRETVPLSGPKFLNSGFIIGPLDKITEVVRSAMQLMDQGYLLEQSALSKVMHDNPNLITLDYGAGLVSNLYGVALEKNRKPMFTWDSGSGTWYNHGIDKTACFLHSSAGGQPFRALFAAQGWSGNLRSKGSLSEETSGEAFPLSWTKRWEDDGEVELGRRD